MENGSGRIDHADQFGFAVGLHPPLRAVDDRVFSDFFRRQRSTLENRSPQFGEHLTVCLNHVFALVTGQQALALGMLEQAVYRRELAQ